MAAKPPRPPGGVASDAAGGSLTGERSGAWRRAPLPRCHKKTPNRGVPGSGLPPSISKREPDAWAAETDGTRECEGAAATAAPFSLESAGLGKMVEVPDPLQPTEHR